MELSKMSWLQIGEYLKENNALILPIGTLEQHGRHLSLGTDTITAIDISKKISEKLNIPIAPSINYGVHFDVDNDYPGVANIKKETLKTILKDLKRTWIKSGFKYIFVISFHDVPEHIEAIVEVGEPYHLIHLSQVNIDDILEKQERIIHACEGETSIMLQLEPESVQMQEAVNANDIEAFMEYHNKGKRFEIDKFPGNLGYSTHGTREKGEKLLLRYVDYATCEINKMFK